MKRIRLLTALVALSSVIGCSQPISENASRALPASSSAETKPAAAASSSSPAASAAPAPTAPAPVPEKVTVGDFTQEKVVTEKLILPGTYKKFMGAGTAGPIVPGLKQGLVPQGVAYLPAKNWLIASSYRDSGAPSVLSVIDAASGRLLKTIVLFENETTPYTGHAGGVAVSAKHLWVGSENLVRAVKLDDLIKVEDGGHVVFGEQFRPETKASFISYADGMLWAGDFYDTPNPTNERHHMKSTDNKNYKAWVVGYKLEADTDLIGRSRPIFDNRAVPDVIFAITDKIQGFTVHKSQILLSQSAGRANDSYMFVYRDARKDKPHLQVKLGDNSVPLWFLDGSNQSDKWIIPPMSEGLENVNDQVAVLFESGADKYRPNGTYPMDQLYMIKLP